MLDTGPTTALPATGVLDPTDATRALPRQPDRGTAVAAAELGPNASFFRCDVTSESEVNAAMNAARERMGSITLLVNCAGIVGAGFT